MHNKLFHTTESAMNKLTTTGQVVDNAVLKDRTGFKEGIMIAFMRREETTKIQCR